MKNKHLLLTGGTGGLGSSVTLLALENQAYVTLPYRNYKEVERLGQTLDSHLFNKVNFIQADMTSEEDIGKITHDMDKIDILIHLVGGFSMGPTSEYALEKWQQQINLNLTSTFLLCKHSLKKMYKNNYGRIVAVGSRAAVDPGAQMAAYCASKAGVIALIKSIAAETKGTNITANVILPSIIDTPANRKTMGDQNAAKWVKPQSLAQVICFLASEKARDMRGAAVPVYGGV